MLSERGYRAVLAHPVASRPAAADALSVLGDYVGLGVLPLLFPGLAATLLAAAVLGMVRAATISVRSATMAEAVPRQIRGRLQALFSISFQAAQVLGLATGAGVAILVGVRAALAADVATFLLAALVLSRLRLPLVRRSERRPSFTTGLATIFGHPTLAVLAPVTWIGMTAGALPETLAPAALGPDHRAWLPWALSAEPLGAAVAAIFVGRSRLPQLPWAQFRYVAAFGVAFAATGLLLERHPAFLLAGNAAAGAGTGWVVATQTTFANLAPPDRMGQVTAVMVASLVMLEGAGALGFGMVAGRWGVGAAYLTIGMVLLATGVVAEWRGPDLA